MSALPRAASPSCASEPEPEKVTTSPTCHVNEPLGDEMVAVGYDSLTRTLAAATSDRPALFVTRTRGVTARTRVRVRTS